MTCTHGIDKDFCQVCFEQTKYLYIVKQKGVKYVQIRTC